MEGEIPPIKIPTATANPHKQKIGLLFFFSMSFPLSFLFSFFPFGIAARGIFVAFYPSRVNALIPLGNYPGALAELSPEEAALAAKWLGLKWAIPMHYEKGSAEPHRFMKAVKRLSPKTKVLLLDPGQWQYFPVRKSPRRSLLP